ncbi:hypothetical protein Cgig2_013966 [Carnegiea gigantea]|uniref:Fungal lipase-type domain-containing protein n=1 Tax=Carnegiea gigantea TaxID=171969 RepID=A0A9Q1KYG1_9CARY|nr:hypothetical protein Cgig2_013966 [Carnegiea gigantea]
MPYISERHCNDRRCCFYRLNPERIGGDFKEEVQVHSGFLSAYDSVRPRLMSVIKKAIGFIGGASGPQFKWHVYCTGHSLGGALATLLALELSSSQLAKIGAISVTMYNFGSPRVGNRRFAEVYNEKVKDSWRVVNHRDIIPTVPRLMGYCHVAQPVYLAAGDHKSVQENAELSGDGYEGDVIGEATPDVLVSEFMKGEKELIDRILQTEINIFRALRDGSALMQHMEDFYYISLLEILTHILGPLPLRTPHFENATFWSWASYLLPRQYGVLGVLVYNVAATRSMPLRATPPAGPGVS